MKSMKQFIKTAMQILRKKLAQPVDFRSNLSDFFCRGINERFEFCYENLSEKAGI